MRRLCTFAAAFCAAVFAAVYLLPRGLWLPGALLCALGAPLCLTLRGGGRKRFLLAALGLAAGLLWCKGYDARIAAPARAVEGQTLTLSAAVDAYPRQTSYGWSVRLRLRLPGGPAVGAVFYLQDGGSLRPGDELRLTGELHPADELQGEPSSYWTSRGVYLVVYERGETECTRPARLPVRYLPALLGQRLREVLYAVRPADQAGVLAALVTGDRTGLSDGFYAALKRCGLAHVVAVSGMHLAFLAGLLQRFTGRSRRRTAVVAAPVLVLFMFLTGLPASVVRAGVMQLLLLLAPALGRERDTPTGLSLALMLLLLWNPNGAADVGLQLSFTSVLGIELLTGRIGDRLDRALGLERPRMGWRELLRRLGRFVTGSLATTVGALALTTPLTVAYFGSVSLVAPLANLLALWAVSLAFCLGLLTAVLGLLWLPLGQLLGLAAGLPCRWLLWLAPVLARFPYASLPLEGRPYLVLWVVFVYLVALVFLLVRGERRRPILPLSACAVTLAAALACNVWTYSGGDLNVSVLDVGQGLCVVLRSAGRTAVVDCGGNRDNAGDLAADHIQSLGTSRVDLLVLTHYHSDHANGVPELLERLEVGALVLPDVGEEDPLRREIQELAWQRGIRVYLLEDNADVTFGEASMRIYAPLGAGDTNEEGLSVLATCGTFDVLITGDMGAVTERRLVRYGALPDVELLVVGHHGSRYATGEELLAAARPDWAVISVGDNGYGHPAEETLARLDAAGCAVYRTDWMGTVTLTAKKED